MSWWMTLLLIAISGYFGFLLGRRWEVGSREEEMEVVEEERELRRNRGRVRLNSIRIRR